VEGLQNQPLFSEGRRRRRREKLASHLSWHCLCL
jgi:hypothetical protein